MIRFPTLEKKVHPERVICVEDRHSKILEDATVCDILLYVFHGEVSWSFLNL